MEHKTNNCNGAIQCQKETFLLYAVFRTQAHFTNIVHTNNDGTEVVNTTLCAVCS